MLHTKKVSPDVLQFSTSPDQSFIELLLTKGEFSALLTIMSQPIRAQD